MKLYHHLAYLVHRLIRRLYRRQGNWKTREFEYHHNKMKHYKGLLALIAVVLFIWNESGIDGC